ncbi:alpha/beta fold hydrolase [Actinomycetota bacterium]
MREEQLSAVDGVLVRPDEQTPMALLVLGPTGEELPLERARVLCRELDVSALALRWACGPDMPGQLLEVDVERVQSAIDLLFAEHVRIGVVGVSHGAALALLLGIADLRLELVVAMSAPSVVWQSPVETPEGARLERSSFAFDGQPLDYLPLVDAREWEGPAFRTEKELRTASLRRYAARLAPARIHVEDISADLVLTVGGDDTKWPSAVMAEEIREQRSSYEQTTTVLHYAGAGHLPVLPGEPPAPAAAGGTPEGNAALGRQILEAIRGRVVVDFDDEDVEVVETEAGEQDEATTDS